MTQPAILRHLRHLRLRIEETLGTGGAKPSRPAPAPVSFLDRLKIEDVTGKVEELDTLTFDEKIFIAKRPAVVLFYSPFDRLADVTRAELERMAKTWAGRLIFAKVDISRNPVLVQKFGAASASHGSIWTFVDGHQTLSIRDPVLPSELAQFLQESFPYL